MFSRSTRNFFEGLPECDRLDKREQRNAALVKPLQVIAVGYWQEFYLGGDCGKSGGCYYDDNCFADHDDNNDCDVIADHYNFHYCDIDYIDIDINIDLQNGSCWVAFCKSGVRRRKWRELLCEYWIGHTAAQDEDDA